MQWPNSLNYLINAGRDPAGTLPDKLAQIRMLTTTSYVYLSTGVLIALFHFYDGVPDVGIVVSLALILGGVNLITLFLFDHVKWNAHIGVALIYITCFVTILIWGGYTGPNFSWLLFVPILAALLVDCKTMWLYFILVVISMIVIIVLQQQGIVPFHSNDFPGFFNAIILHRFGLIALICIILQAYYSERRRYEKSIQDLSQRARYSNHEKDRFIATISQEITGHLKEIIKISNAFDEAEQNSISKLAASMSLTLKNAIDYSRIGSGGVEIISCEFDLPKAIKDTISLYTERCREKNIQLTLHFMTEIPEQVIGDQLRYQQILANLLTNAVDFTEKGKIEIEISFKKTSQKQILLSTEIKDTGAGMSESIQHKIRESFKHADDTIINHYAGKGVGLTLADRLCKLMGGALYLESERGKGSTFTFDCLLGLLPGRSESLGGDIFFVEHSPAQSHTFSGHILVAEDNVIVQALIRSQLDNLNLTYDFVTTEEELTTALKSRQYDLMLIDCHLPKIDGLLITANIRSEPSAYQHIPIIGITKQAQNGVITRCMSSGMDDFITKPFKQVAIHDTLAKWLKS